MAAEQGLDLFAVFEDDLVTINPRPQTLNPHPSTLTANL
jgi:hypothetical protein